MIYSNVSGTTKPSFVIGPNGITLSSSAVIQDPTHLLNGFRRLCVANNNGKTGSLVYDIEIPMTIVQSCEQDIEDPNVYILTLFDRRTGEKRIIRINAGLGNSGVAFAGETSEENNLASFADTSGRYIKDSGYSVHADSIDESTAASQTDQLPTVSAVYEFVGDLTEFLKDRLRGKL